MSTHAPMALEQNVAEAVAALARTLYPHVALRRAHLLSR